MAKLQLNRRTFLKLMGSSTLAVASSSILAQNNLQNKSSRPNIVLIISDDHGTDALGCYGNSNIKTPYLDQLAAEGVRFSHAFCTTSSCSPSRSVILTGLHNHANGMYGLQHTVHHFQSFDSVKSLPIHLQEAGYRTARIGKFHLAPESTFKFEKILSHGKANDMQSIGRSPVEMADQCTDYVNDEENRPFFLLYAVDDPHRGLPFDNWPGPNPFGNTEKGYPGVKQIKYKPENVVVPPFLPDTPQSRIELAEYYQSVSRMDQGIGRLVKILKDSGKYDNTVILYISDNGIAFPGAKTTLYEPGMRLPCIVRTPWQDNAGIMNNALISWTDITPTILDIAGSTVNKEEFHGRSFKNILEEKEPMGWDRVFASHSFHEITMYYPMRVIRGRKYKLIWNIAHKLEYPFAADLAQSTTWRGVLKSGSTMYGKRSIDAFKHRPKYELYDLENDPDELVNLADDPKHSSILHENLAQLKAFQERTNDKWVHKWDYE
jgi:N-sulfoglucosamine sulfohydrolase